MGLFGNHGFPGSVGGVVGLAIEGYLRLFDVGISDDLAGGFWAFREWRLPIGRITLIRDAQYRLE
jgi:hypothetical protein